MKGQHLFYIIKQQAGNSIPHEIFSVKIELIFGLAKGQLTAATLSIDCKQDTRLQPNSKCFLAFKDYINEH